MKVRQKFEIALTCPTCLLKWEVKFKLLGGIYILKLYGTLRSMWSLLNAVMDTTGHRAHDLNHKNLALLLRQSKCRGRKPVNAALSCWTGEGGKRAYLGPTLPSLKE